MQYQYVYRRVSADPNRVTRGPRSMKVFQSHGTKDVAVVDELDAVPLRRSCLPHRSRGNLC